MHMHLAGNPPTAHGTSGAGTKGQMEIVLGENVAGKEHANYEYRGIALSAPQPHHPTLRLPPPSDFYDTRI